MFKQGLDMQEQKLLVDELKEPLKKSYLRWNALLELNDIDLSKNNRVLSFNTEKEFYETGFSLWIEKTEFDKFENLLSSATPDHELLERKIRKINYKSELNTANMLLRAKDTRIMFCVLFNASVFLLKKNDPDVFLLIKDDLDELCKISQRFLLLNHIKSEWDMSAQNIVPDEIHINTKEIKIETLLDFLVAIAERHSFLLEKYYIVRVNYIGNKIDLTTLWQNIIDENKTPA